MEAGSLLKEALDAMQRQRELGGSSEDFIETTVFLVDDDDCDPDHFEKGERDRVLKIAGQYAQLGAELNDFVSEEVMRDGYLWDVGGTGPTFGFDVICTESEEEYVSLKRRNHNNIGMKRGNVHMATHCRPCLKCILNYGGCMDDVWYWISLLLKFTETSRYLNVAVQVTEGPRREQVILVEAANVLPKWVADAGSDGCRGRVWIMRGKCCLIAPRSAYPLISRANDNDATIKAPNNSITRSLSLDEALSYLALAIKSKDFKKGSWDKDKMPNMISCHDFSEILLEISSKIQNAVYTRVDKIGHESRYHSASVILPLTIARLLLRRPDMIAASIKSFVQSLYTKDLEKHRRQKRLKCFSQNGCADEKLVFVTLRFTKANFALLMGYLDNFLVPEYYISCTGFQHLKLVCSENAHVKHAIDLGYRISAGLQWLFEDQDVQQVAKECLPSWMDLCSRLITTKSAQSSVLQKKDFDSEHFRHCATFLAIPSKNAYTINGMCGVSEDVRLSADPPDRYSVDNDDWLTLSSSELDKMMEKASNDDFDLGSMFSQSATPNQSEMDQIELMMNGLHSFVSQSSDYQGVRTTSSSFKRTKSSKATKDLDRDVNIDTSKFMNILQGTFNDLDSDDDFFSDDDNSSNCSDEIELNASDDADGIENIMVR